MRIAIFHSVSTDDIFRAHVHTDQLDQQINPTRHTSHSFPDNTPFITAAAVYHARPPTQPCDRRNTESQIARDALGG